MCLISQLLLHEIGRDFVIVFSYTNLFLSLLRSWNIQFANSKKIFATFSTFRSGFGVANNESGHPIRFDETQWATERNNSMEIVWASWDSTVMNRDSMRDGWKESHRSQTWALHRWVIVWNSMQSVTCQRAFVFLPIARIHRPRRARPMSVSYMNKFKTSLRWAREQASAHQKIRMIFESGLMQWQMERQQTKRTKNKN